MLDRFMKQMVLMVLLLWILTGVFWSCEALLERGRATELGAIAADKIEMVVSNHVSRITEIQSEILKDPERISEYLSGLGRTLCFAGQCFILAAVAMTVGIVRSDDY